MGFEFMRAAGPVAIAAGVRRPFVRAGIVALSLLVLSCGPAARSGEQSAGDPRSQPAGPKTVRVGMVASREPRTGIGLGAGGIGGLEHNFTFHAGLTVYDAQGNLLPAVAAKVPTVEDGDWQVFPDGRMQVTWKLRPDAKWHDGAPATASDFVFGMKILRDRDLPFRQNRAASLISDIRASDPHTLVVDWMEPYAYANVSAPIDTPVTEGVMPNVSLKRSRRGNDLTKDRGHWGALVNRSRHRVSAAMRF